MKGLCVMSPLRPAYKNSREQRLPDVKVTRNLSPLTDHIRGREKVMRLLTEQPHRCKIADVNENERVQACVCVCVPGCVCTCAYVCV